MPLLIVQNDVATMKVDAVVNITHEHLLASGRAGSTICRTITPELLSEYCTLEDYKTGQSNITSGYRLPARFVIHTAGPIWLGGDCGERDLLVSAYRSSLELALTNQCETVAFPLISSGICGYPKDQALKVAVETIQDFLFTHDMTVYLVIFDRATSIIDRKLCDDIAAYIDHHYVTSYTDSQETQRFDKTLAPLLMENNELEQIAKVLSDIKDPFSDNEETYSLNIALSSVSIEDDEWEQTAAVPSDVDESLCHSRETRPLSKALTSESAEDDEWDQNTAVPFSLDDALRELDESFSQMLLRKIDEAGLTDAQCYKRANIDRKLFSKIRSNVHYKPSKSTAMAFAIALELSLEEAREMLGKAGFSFSHSCKFDIIIEYFIAHRNYNIFEINEALFAFDQSLLGS